MESTAIGRGTRLDATVLGGKKYEGGCKFLLKWFNDKVCVDVA